MGGPPACLQVLGSGGALAIDGEGRYDKAIKGWVMMMGMRMGAALVAALVGIVATLVPLGGGPQAQVPPNGLVRRANVPGAGGLMASQVAVQLYSVRADMARDRAATFERLYALGVRRVELYGLPTDSAEALRKDLETAGLTPIGGHVALADLRDRLPDVITTAKALGYRYVGLGWIKTTGPGVGLTPAEVDAAAAVFNAACPALRRAGLRALYHVHGYEFAPDPLTGATLLDRLLGETDGSCVELQLDVFWATLAGQDVIALLSRYPGRIRTLHLRDLRAGVKLGRVDGASAPGDGVPLGAGVIDWPALLSAARRARIEWYVLEDDSPEPEAHLRQSVAYLAGLKADDLMVRR